MWRFWKSVGGSAPTEAAASIVRELLARLEGLSENEAVQKPDDDPCEQQQGGGDIRMPVQHPATHGEWATTKQSSSVYILEFAGIRDRHSLFAIPFAHPYVTLPGSSSSRFR